MFEHTLSPEGKASRGWRRSRFFPAALAVHVAALLVVLGASLWNVDDPPEPPVPITWVSTDASVPARPAESSAAPRPATGPRTERRAVVVPAAVPDSPPIAASLPEPAADFAEPGDAAPGAQSNAGGPDGEGPGVPGGWGPGGSDPTGSNRGILVPGGNVHAPILVRRVEPVYPEGARKARMEGDVVLEAIITSLGEIEEVRVVKSAGPLFDASARDAVERWKYRPATLNGRAVRVLLTVTITFRLH